MRFQMSHRSRNSGFSSSTCAPWDACTCFRSLPIIWCCTFFRGMIYQYLLGPFSGATHALSNEPSLAKYRLELVELRTVGCMQMLETTSNHMMLQMFQLDDLSLSTWSILRSYSCAFLNEPLLAKYRLELVDLRTVRCMQMLVGDVLEEVLDKYFWGESFRSKPGLRRAIGGLLCPYWGVLRT